MVRTRIAPSPTGFPHIGTIYQALFDSAYAKKNNGVFYLRIEDTDQTRYVEGAEENIKDSLEWFCLTPNESPWSPGEFGPYRQSERLSLYHTYAQELIDKDKAYFAYFPKSESGEKDHTKKEVAAVEFSEPTEKPSTIAELITMQDWIVRMRIPKDTTVTIRDEIRGEISFASNDITEQVLIKSDGFPTYHLASVVDDHLMGTTHLVRGEEWLTSTPKHWLLYEYFGWEKPLFFHTPVLRNPDKSKLSKRHGHTSVDFYRTEGYLPEAILNFLALLGWSHPEEKEKFDMQEFISLLELKDIKPVAPIFDIKKLEWLNGQYIYDLSNEELLDRLEEFDGEFIKSLSHLNLLDLVEIVKTRIKTLKEFKILVEQIMSPQVGSLTPEQIELRSQLHSDLSSIDTWNKDTIFTVIKGNFIEKGIKFPSIYKAVLGIEKGLPLADTFAILGKETTLRMLQ